MVAVETASFRHGPHRLVYDSYGEGPLVVLVHGLLLSRRMHAPLAQSLAERGYRVVCLDVLGHGDSDRPRDMTCYSMPVFGEQVVGLLDHLGVEQAVVGGTSLGANVSLEVGMCAPDRVRGLVIEMPVLDNALLAVAMAFMPLLVGLTLGLPFARLGAAAARRLPRGRSQLADIVIDAVSQDPGPSGAVLQGLFFTRVAPPHTERMKIATRTLVLGHPRDPIHPFSDADMLIQELPNARLVRAHSLLELRMSPGRLTGEIAAFVEECWADAPAKRRRASTRRAGTRGSAAAGRARRTA